MILLIEAVIFIILIISTIFSIKTLKNLLKSLLSPLKTIIKKTEEISKGNFDIKIHEKSQGYDINMLVDAVKIPWAQTLKN